MTEERTGYWEYHDDSKVVQFTYFERKYHACSVCGAKENTEIARFKYCFNCGAKMLGVRR